MASAAGYDDFAHGLSANQSQNNDAAIAAFTAAISAGDLPATLLPTAYRERGLAYLRSHRCDAAFTDLDVALKLRPGDVAIAMLHAESAVCLKKTDVALADLAPLTAAGDNAQALLLRGRLLWNGGDFADAAQDFVALVKVRPTFPYAVLWLEMSRLRSGGFDPAMAAKDVDRFDVDTWPGPLLALYAGALKPDTAAAAITRRDMISSDARQCEADFYIGEWWLAHDEASQARSLLQRAADRCPIDYIEREEARIELGRMK